MCLSAKQIVVKVIMTALLVAIFSAPQMALAKRGSDEKQRSHVYGIVSELPEGRLHGVWVIGGVTVTTEAGTEFDQSDGELKVGSCAKVEVRNGRVHEIESEPMSDCQ